ncbi:MAG: protein-glutamine glutaminase family protein [Bdellovibrionota bacterium]
MFSVVMWDINRRIFCFLLVLAATLSAAADLGTRVPSARRAPGVDYKAYTSDLPVLAGPKLFVEPGGINNPGSVSIPAYANFEEMLADFKLIRDERDLIADDNSSFSRRNPYLYPMDGCWVRAAHMNHILTENGRPVLPKIFVFGNLSVDSPYSQQGKILWVYHVAPGATLNGEIYLFDPSIEPATPIRLDDWLSRMGVSRISSEIQICNSRTYDTSDSCVLPGSEEQRRFDFEIQSYLSLEWDNLEKLNLNPLVLLGEKPPWLTRQNASPQRLERAVN